MIITNHHEGKLWLSWPARGAHRHCYFAPRAYCEVVVPMKYLNRKLNHTHPQPSLTSHRRPTTPNPHSPLTLTRPQPSLTPTLTHHQPSLTPNPHPQPSVPHRDRQYIIRIDTMDFLCIFHTWYLEIIQNTIQNKYKYVLYTIQLVSHRIIYS